MCAGKRISIPGFDKVYQVRYKLLGGRYRYFPEGEQLSCYAYTGGREVRDLARGITIQKLGDEWQVLVRLPDSEGKVMNYLIRGKDRAAVKAALREHLEARSAQP